MDDLDTLRSQLKRLDTLIEEAEFRLGAHSVKPVLMQRLFELEEARDALTAKIARHAAGQGREGAE